MWEVPVAICKNHLRRREKVLQNNGYIRGLQLSLYPTVHRLINGGQCKIVSFHCDAEYNPKGTLPRTTVKGELTPVAVITMNSAHEKRRVG
jgi:hypothetical protein